MDRYRGHFQITARSGGTGEVAIVLSPGGEACHHLISFRDLILDAVVAGSGLPENFESLLQPFPTGTQTRKGGRIVVDVIFGYQFIHGVQASFVNLFVECAYESLVRFG